MKRLVCVVLLTACSMATPALAAKVYLKDGSVITAKKVWRAGGKVQVLINRDSLEEFLPSEVDMKRTFAKRRRPARPAPSAVTSAAPTAGSQAAPATAQKPADKKTAISLPKLPAMPTKLPEKSPPALSQDEGTIRKHKKEMADKANE